MHPSIPVERDGLRVAEIGLATGYLGVIIFNNRGEISSFVRIWLTDLARYLPASARIDGFDIDISQCPPKEWLPANVSVHQLDCLAPIPPNLVEQYDILHIQLFQLGVQNREPEPIVQNLLCMLSTVLVITRLNSR